MRQILEGIRVVDWSYWHQGPAAGYILGDLGAEVIKIEDPVQGDPLRGASRFMGMAMTLAGGRNALFELPNRNKKAITLDIRKEKGREVLNRLLQKSDVFITNFRRGVRKRLGLDYEALGRVNPRLIYCSASGWGRQGPDADLRSFDTLGVARSGLMYNIGEPDMPPQQMVFGVADQMGATMAAFGIVAALLERERSGLGQEVEASLFGTMIHAQAMALSAFLLTGEMPPRPARRKQFNPLIGWYRCRDGEWVIFSHNQPQGYWRQFCLALGLQELEKDPRFSTTKARGENCEELIGIIDRVMATRPQGEWLEAFRQHDLIFAPVRRLSELATDPQAVENQYLVDFDHPTLGAIKMLGFPVQFSRTPARIQRVAPEFGEHTEEVLLELGYSWDVIAQFREEGII